MLALLKKHILFLTILPLFLLAVASSYVRFMVLHDNLVQYEIDCDPQTEACFVGCEDDECTELYHYSYIVRPAQEILSTCGEDITDCDAASFCDFDQLECERIFCDPTDELAECDELEQ